MGSSSGGQNHFRGAELPPCSPLPPKPANVYTSTYFHHRNSEEKEKKAKVYMSHDPGGCHMTITCTAGRRGEGEREAAQRVPGEGTGDEGADDEGTHTTTTNTNPAGKHHGVSLPLYHHRLSKITSSITLPYIVM